MTSVLLTTDVVGGVWDFSCALAAGLRDLDLSVTLLAWGKPDAEHRRAASAAGAELLSADLRLEWMQASGSDVDAAERIVQDLVQQRRPDLLHSNQFAPVSFNLGVPVVLTLHSDVLSWRRWVLGEPRPTEAPGLPHYYPLVHRALKVATAVTSVSRFLADQVRDLYGSNLPIQVIHNGWTSHPARRQPLPTTERQASTLVAGRVWDPAKNVRLVLEAAEGWSPGPVLLAGSLDHPEGGAAPSLNTTLVQPLGFVHRAALDRLLGESTVYLSPALYDPFGLLPLQAALAGCPLLLSDISSYRELWDGAALFFDPRNPTDLRQAWQELLHDHELAASLALEANRRALSQLNAASMVRAYADLYARLLSNLGGSNSEPVSALAQSAR